MFQDDNFMLLPPRMLDKRIKRKLWTSEVSVYSPAINGFITAKVSNKISARLNSIAISSNLKQSLGLNERSSISITDKGKIIMIEIK